MDILMEQKWKAKFILYVNFKQFVPLNLLDRSKRVSIRETGKNVCRRDDCDKFTKHTSSAEQKYYCQSRDTLFISKLYMDIVSKLY